MICETVRRKHIGLWVVEEGRSLTRSALQTKTFLQTEKILMTRLKRKDVESRVCYILQVSSEYTYKINVNIFVSFDNSFFW